MDTLLVPLESAYNTYFSLLALEMADPYPDIDTIRSFAVGRYIKQCEAGEVSAHQHVGILENGNDKMFDVATEAEEFFRGQVRANKEARTSKIAGSNALKQAVENAG